MEVDTAAAICVSLAVTAIAAFIATGDGRTFRDPPTQVYTIPSSAFEEAFEQEANGWFVRMVRCTFESFVQVAHSIRVAWPEVHGPPPDRGRPSKLSHAKKVVLCMHYLASGATIASACASFGISKTRGVVAINQVLLVLKHIAKEKLDCPLDTDSLEAMAHDFERVCGFPDTIGAIDGTLIRIARPREHEGWYCRKGYPAVNVQAVVDSHARFLSCSIRSGSSNDQSLWNRSGFRQRLLQAIPERFHLVGDSGYKLWCHLLTPYPELEAFACPKKSLYNYCHSKTRIVVERAFGILKNRWRILLRKVDQKSDSNIGNVIVACMVLHNLLIEFGDTVEVSGVDPESSESQFQADFFLPTSSMRIIVEAKRSETP